MTMVNRIRHLVVLNLLSHGRFTSRPAFSHEVISNPVFLGCFLPIMYMWVTLCERRLCVVAEDSVALLPHFSCRQLACLTRDYRSLLHNSNGNLIS